MTQILLKIVFASFVVGTAVGQICPDTCDNVVCETSITQADCGVREYLVKGFGPCGCCYGCTERLGFGESRCVSDDSDPIRLCAPGLMCDPLTPRTCIRDKSTCHYVNFLDPVKYLWRPTCDIDGNYVAKQCKGDRAAGRCFCYNENGNRIFGWDWWRNADDMTCACSRLRDKIESSGEISTLHCKQNGNFEELQCDKGACWCADDKSGAIQIGTAAVPQDLWEMLPCYNSTLLGKKYLRQCESNAYAQNIMRKTLALHGTTDLSIRNVMCSYDGTFGTLSVENGIASCVWRDGVKIGSYSDTAHVASVMNCYCARDQKIFAENDLTMTILCGGRGNYESLQEQNGIGYCVDQDGFATTPLNLDLSQTQNCNLYDYREAPEKD